MPQSQTHQFLLNRSVDVSCQHQVKSIHLYTKCYSLFLSFWWLFLFQHRPYSVCECFCLCISFQAHTTDSFHIVNLFKGFFNMHSKINICYIMQKWNLLLSLIKKKSSCSCCCFVEWSLTFLSIKSVVLIRFLIWLPFSFAPIISSSLLRWYLLFIWYSFHIPSVFISFIFFFDENEMISNRV